VEPILTEINADDVDAVIVHGRSPRVDAVSIAQEVGQTIPLSYCATYVGRDRTYEIIEQIGDGASVTMLCELFDIPRSCFYAYRHRRERVDTARMALRSSVHELFVESRSSAGSRSIMGMLREQCTTIGRFKVSRLMDELGLICKQPGSHAYKRATVERIDSPNVLNRDFDVRAPNQVWCGDITYS
jgi:putative transposase